MGVRDADRTAARTPARCASPDADDGRTMVVHTPDAIRRWHEAADVLDGSDVLPGFSVVTSAVFADLKRDPMPAFDG